MKIYLSKDSGIKLNLPKVVKYLNEKCKYLKFEALPVSFDISEKEISHPKTHKKYLAKIKKPLQGGDFIILITDVQYDDNYFYNEENRLVILSFFAWKYLTDLPNENGLVYFICSMLMYEVNSFDSVNHEKRLGCVNDFMGDKTRVDDGMRKGHLCASCKNLIRSLTLTGTQASILADINLLLKELSGCSKTNRNIIGGKEMVHAPEIKEIKYNVKKKITHKKTETSNGVAVFISYSHKDDRERIKLENHLQVLQKSGMIRTWTDRKIDAGEEWENQIDSNLNTSQIVLMLISSNFMASNYCYDMEMKAALKRHTTAHAIVIPIILRACLWQVAPFAKLQLLPKDGKPIQNFTRKDDAYAAIAKAIWDIIQKKFK